MNVITYALRRIERDIFASAQARAEFAVIDRLAPEGGLGNSGGSAKLLDFFE